MTESDKLVRQIRRVISDLRADEERIKDASASRSTRSRNLYKAGYVAVADIERIVARKGRKK